FDPRKSQRVTQNCGAACVRQIHKNTTITRDSMRVRKLVTREASRNCPRRSAPLAAFTERLGDHEGLEATSPPILLLQVQNQNTNRRTPCITRGVRVAVTLPNAALVCWP